MVFTSGLLKEKLSIISSIVAPRITGRDRKNENFTAFSLEIPKKRPALIVMPDREIPGINAHIWAHPIIRAGGKDNSFFCSFINLVKYKTIPVKMSEKETKRGFWNKFEIVSLKTSPTTPLGIVPAIIRIPSSESELSVNL